MKKLLMIAVLAPMMCLAETNDTAMINQLLIAKYNRDMKSETGRQFWHGKKMSVTADPSNGVQIVVYEDGKTFRDPAKVTRPIDSVNAANKKLKRETDKKGVPKKLAEARARREEEKNTVSNVTITVEAGR